ncbi:GxxExxY protein [bacterium]|nr:MAG: GxxExxY protein [bacterium]
MKEFKPLDQETERIAKEIVDAAFKVHKELGPGLLESVYEACLTHELRKRGLQVETQLQLPVRYETVQLDIGFRLDLLVEEEIIVELKAVEVMIPLFEAQLLTYLKLAGKRLGFLINFNVPLIKNGIKRLIL